MRRHGRIAALLVAALALGLVGLTSGALLSQSAQPACKPAKRCPPTTGTTTPPPTSTVEPPPTTTTPTPGLDPSGVPLPIGDLSGWRQVWKDNFPTDVPLGSFPEQVIGLWGAYPEGYPGSYHDTTGWGYYSPHRTVSINGGVLHVNMHTEAAADGKLVHWTAALTPRLPAADGQYGQLYGRYAIRFRVVQGDAGYKMAWLLWPDSETWPRDGEIDFPEGDLCCTIAGFMHRQNGTSGADQDAYQPGIPFGTGWHTAVTEWSPAAVRFILDGQTIGTSTSRIPNTEMHYVIQNETWFNGVPANTAVGRVDIDWVSIYSYNP